MAEPSAEECVLYIPVFVSYHEVTWTLEVEWNRG